MDVPSESHCESAWCCGYLWATPFSYHQVRLPKLLKVVSNWFLQQIYHLNCKFDIDSTATTLPTIYYKILYSTTTLWLSLQPSNKHLDCSPSLLILKNFSKWNLFVNVSNGYIFWMIFKIISFVFEMWPSSLSSQYLLYALLGGFNILIIMTTLQIYNTIVVVYTFEYLNIK